MLAGAVLLPMRAGTPKVQSSRARAKEHSVRTSALHRGGRRPSVDVLEGEHGRIDVRFAAFTYIGRKALL